jgi:hypothetical protein
MSKDDDFLGRIQFRLFCTLQKLQNKPKSENILKAKKWEQSNYYLTGLRYFLICGSVVDFKVFSASSAA